MRYYVIGEFAHSLAKEWYPLFTSTLYDHLSSIYPDVQKSSVRKVDGQVRYHTVPELPYEVVVVVNTVWFFDIEEKKAIGITTHDNLEQIILEGRSFIEDFDTTLYTGDFDPDRIQGFREAFSHYKKEIKFKPWRYTTHKWEPPTGTYAPSDDKLFFRGYFLNIQRGFLKSLEARKIEDIDISFNDRLLPDEFFRRCASSLGCLASSGVHDMCNRDIELFCLGVPIIRPRFRSILDIEIPEDVYFPVDFIPNTNPKKDMPLRHRFFPLYPEKLADDVLTLWNEIKHDKELLLKVGKNAREFYLEYFTNEKLLEHTTNIITSEIG